MFGYELFLYTTIGTKALVFAGLVLNGIIGYMLMTRKIEKPSKGVAQDVEGVAV